MQTRHIGGSTYFSRAQLETTNPSRREGIDAVAEARWRTTTSKLVKTAIKTLKLPDWVYETSMNYINRFFLTRSISKNDRHLVVGGAILLASKVQESPRPVQDVAYVLLQLKHANKKPQHGPDQTTLEQFIEGVMLAEQAMLFSLNFNLNVETHVSLARRLLEPLDLWAKANPAPEEAEANQLKLSLYAAVMFFLNDSALTNLSLQYPNSKVAPVTLVMAAKRLAATRYSGKEAPPALQRVLALATDSAWFESKGLSLEAAADIEAQINELYASSPAQPAAQQQLQRQQQPQAAQTQHAVAAGQLAAAEPPRPSQKPDGSATAVRPLQAAAQRGAAAAADAINANGRGAEALTARAATPTLAAATVPTSSVQAPMLQANNEVSSADHKGCDAAPQRPGSPASADAEVGATNTTPCCRQGQPSSSAAVATAVAGTTAGGTPELPHPRDKSQPQQQVRGGKRVSDGDECMGEQQATSELHAVPEQPPDVEAETAAAARDAGGAAPCVAYDGPEDSANENCSPNGLTTGNASGSGCGVAEGQPEVCSRTEAPGMQLLQSQPTQPQSLFDVSGFEGSQHQTSQSQQQCSKRRGRDGEDGIPDELAVVGVLAPALKARRLEESQPVSVQHGP